MKSRYQFCILVLALMLLFSSQVRLKSFAQQETATQYHVVINSAAHQRFGLYYPVTYMFEIPDGSSNLSAQYRYNADDPWNTLDNKTSADLFNGINAARFDYANNVAYLSVAFSLDSDVIYLRILNGEVEIPVVYIGIPQYYDDRHAAVTITLDMWTKDFDSSFNWANYYLTELYHLYYTVGIWSLNGLGEGPDWSLIQYWYDRGYMEPASYSMTNPCNDVEYQVNGYDWEIAGSRDWIKSHLVLDYPYVPVFIEPCGFSSPQVRQAVVAADYLVERGYPIPPSEDTFSEWGSDGAYDRVKYSYDTLSWPQASGGTPELLAEANSRFDAVYAAGDIYHLRDYPWRGNWFTNSYLLQHIGYISNRLDVWYAAFGEIYLYHFVQERGLVFVSPVIGDQESFFHGGVHISDNPPSDGDILSASVTGVATPFTTLIHSGSTNLVYGISIPGDDPITPGKEGGQEGDEVTFSFGTRQVAKGIWHSNINQNLDIHPPAANSGGPYTTSEGTTVILNASGSTDWGGDISRYEWDLDNNGITETLGITAQFLRLDNAPTPHTIRLQVWDNQFGVGTTTTTVTVNNVNPALTVPGDQTAHGGVSTSIALGSFTDPGLDSPWHVVVNWGDGSPNTTFDVTSTGALPNQSHIYPQGQTVFYTVQVTVTDKDGGFDSETFLVNEGSIYIPMVIRH